MSEERAQQQFPTRLLRQSADVLGVAVSRLTRRSRTIDDLLVYFETGTLPKRTKKDPPFPNYESPGVLIIEDQRLAVISVERAPHLFPIIEVAHVTFSSLPRDEAVPPPIGFSFTFTSAVPLGRNLREFTEEVLKSQKETKPDLPPIGDFLH